VVLKKEGISSSSYEDVLNFRVSEVGSAVPSANGVATDQYREANLSSTSRRHIDPVEKPGDRVANPLLETGVR
jgi:hypothetical protein